MTYEYMRGNGTGEATVENTYTYDALHRATSVHENYGNDNRSYTYDSLGNLTYETAQGSKSVDYKLNNLNQITSSSDDGWKTSTTYTYDKRGNLVQELYTKNNKQSVTGTYTYDETNKMVQGVNDIGESSEYLYNGLGALVTNTWTIKKNAYGYHDVQLSAVIEGETVVDADSGKKAKKEKKTAEEVAASPELSKTSTVVKEFVVDYTTETYEPLMEHEVGGLDYRYVYGNDRLSVNITGVENGSSKLIENGNQIRLYYHMDYLGTADYLTSPLTGKVESWTHYNEWGEIVHNAVLKCGQRELDMVKRYATHDYDQVLGMYYAKARFYDADNRRFAAVDPILDPSQYDLREYVKEPMALGQYLYVRDNAIILVDSLGQSVEDVTRTLARWVIANPAAVWITQNPGWAGEKIFYAAGFERDSNGIYHARQDALQQYGGYNSLYDVVFDYATSMRAEYFTFTYNGQDYRFWAWKGDYLNLGAGAELGIYKRFVISETNTPHWLVDTDLVLPMTLKLVDNKGNQIAYYSPSEPQWWITSFNPYYQKVEACNLSVTYTVDFSGDKGMYNAFVNSTSFKYDDRWSISPDDDYVLIFEF